jgi:hypothetical protein
LGVASASSPNGQAQPQRLPLLSHFLSKEEALAAGRCYALVHQRSTLFRFRSSGAKTEQNKIAQYRHPQCHIVFFFGRLALESCQQDGQGEDGKH